MTRYDSTVQPGAPAPRVSLDAGPDWQRHEVPEAALALVHSTDNGHFAPNLVVFTDVRSPGFEPRSVVEALDGDTGRPDLVAEEPFATNIAGRIFAARVVSFTDPSAGTLAQLHLATAVQQPAEPLDGMPTVGSAGPVSVGSSSVGSSSVGSIYVVATVAGERVADDLPLFKPVLDTMKISAGAEQGRA